MLTLVIIATILFFYYIDANPYVLFLLAVPLVALDICRNLRPESLGSFGLTSILFSMLLFSMWIYSNDSVLFANEASLFQSRLIEIYGDSVIKAFVLSIAGVAFAHQAAFTQISAPGSLGRLESRLGRSNHRRIIRNKALLYSGLFMAAVAASMIIDLAFVPTILNSTYNEFETRLSGTPLLMYLHFIFPAFLLPLLVMADLNVPQNRARKYMSFISAMAVVGFLKGSKGMFLFIFFAWGFYYYYWGQRKARYVRLGLVALLCLVTSISVSYLRGMTIKGFISSRPGKINLVESMAELPWQIPLLPLAPYQTATTIQLREEGVFLKGQSYLDLIPMIMPTFVAETMGIGRPGGGAVLYSSYAPSVGGINMVGEAYWNLGRYGPFIVFFIAAKIIAFLERLAGRYGWAGKSVPLYLFYVSLIGIGYGTSSLWGGIRIALLLLLFIHYGLFRPARALTAAPVATTKLIRSKRV
jgi:hypothetical protein